MRSLTYYTRKTACAGVIFCAFVLCACSEADTPSVFTGNESVYVLRSGPLHGLSGTVTFREKVDGSTFVLVELARSAKGMRYPVHLHCGSLSESGTEMIAMLNPVVSEQGISETTLSYLANDDRITYQDLMHMKACIKIHLSDIGAERDVVIAGANVGDLLASGAFGVCKSE